MPADSDAAAPTPPPVEIISPWSSHTVPDRRPTDDPLQLAARLVHAITVAFEQARRRKNLSISEVAADVRIRRHTYSDIITGQTWPSIETLGRIAAKLDLSLVASPAGIEARLTSTLAQLDAGQIDAVLHVAEEFARSNES